MVKLYEFSLVMENLNFWIVISFCYPMLFGANNIINGILVNRGFRNPFVLTFYKSITNVLFVPLLFILGEVSFPSYWLLVLYFIVALFDLGYLVPYYVALKHIDTSIVTALFALGRVVILVLSYVFLDERLSFVQYLGFMIIILSSIFLSITSYKNITLNKAFYLMVLSSFMHSLFLVLEKYVINKDGNWVNMVFYPSVFSMIIPFVLFFSVKLRREIGFNFALFKGNIKLFIMMEIFSFIALCTITFVLPYISVEAKAAISSTTPIFVLIMGVILGKCFNVKILENITKKEVIKKVAMFLLIGVGTYLVVM